MVGEIHRSAGLIQQRRSRASRTLVSVYRAREAALDPTDGPYATVCEDHGAICNHQTLRRARAFAPYPFNWCEDCMEAEYGDPV